MIHSLKDKGASSAEKCPCLSDLSVPAPFMHTTVSFFFFMCLDDKFPDNKLKIFMIYKMYDMVC